MCSAITRRTPRSGSRRPSPLDADADERTSSSVIRPPGPVPVTTARSTESSCAIRRTTGVACTRSGRAAAETCNRLLLGWSTAAAAGFGACNNLSLGASPARADASLGSPMTTSTAPTGATSPSATTMRSTVPAYGEGTSTVALSVWISTSGSSSAISCPSVTSQRAISPSVRPSPRSGSLNSLAIATCASPGTGRLRSRQRRPRSTSIAKAASAMRRGGARNATADA